MELKWTKMHLAPEGYRPEEEAHDPWLEIISAAQNRVVMENTVLGTEVIQVDGEKIPAWVLSFDGIKGLIPLPETGLKTTAAGNGTSEKAAFEANLRRMQRFVGRPVDFLVTHVDRDANLVVLSRKKAEELKRDITWPKLKVDQVVEGTVREFGYVRKGPLRRARVAYLDITGVRGVLPAGEVSWGWTGDLREELALDQVLKVKITAMDPEKKEVTVSRRLLLPDPWPRVPDLYKVGGVYAGTVSGVDTFAREGGNPVALVFVRLAEGVDLAAPLPPFAVFRRGDRVNVRVTRIDAERRRMGGRIVGGTRA